MPFRAANNLPWTAPKLPLLIQTIWSPGLTTAQRAATNASTLACTEALSPKGLRAFAASQFKPPLWQNDRSALSRLHGSCDFTAPNFIVLLRGSNAARMRPGFCCESICCLRPSKVVRMAVGWCAKSSYTVTSPSPSLTVPRISMRRRTFSKRLSACAAMSGATPTCSAAAMAASAFSWLCWPDSDQFTVAMTLPCCKT